MGESSAPSLPNPADLARRQMRSRVTLPKDVRSTVDVTLRGLSIVARTSETPTDSAASPGEVRFRSLLATSTTADVLLDDWKSSRGVQLTVAEAVLFEAHFASCPFVLLDGIEREDHTYRKTLQTAREMAAFAVHAFARETNWRRPVLFVQALKVARGYLRSVVGAQELTSSHRRREFSGRLGVATVLVSRFESIPIADAEEAIAALEMSIVQGNDPWTAVPYLLEAGVVLFDLHPDPAALVDLLARAKDSLGADDFVANPSAQLAAADAYLRLAGVATASARGRILACAAGCVDAALDHDADPDDEVKALMLRAIVKLANSEPGLMVDGRTAGLRIPFGARNSGASEILREYAAELTEAIIDRAFAGDLLARGVCADLLASGHGSAPIERIRQVVELRRGRGRNAGLDDERSVLLGIRDALLLASVDSDAIARARQIEELVTLAVQDPTTAMPVLLLAQDLEANGPIQLLGRLSDAAADFARWLSSGDVSSLFANAAARALASPDLAEIAMGGRSEVTTVGDYYGLVSQNFVIKEVATVGLERERRRIDLLTRAISQSGRGSEYRVTQHLTDFAAGKDRRRSVRRFVSGVPVARAVMDLDAVGRINLIVRVAEFLAFMNGAEIAGLEGVRKELKEREVQRWLRALGVDDPGKSFADWWSMVEGLPLTRRRDAHLDNWVLVEDGSLLALDLEAVGSRPIGYELAQMTDDAPVFLPGDWSARERIFSAYIASLPEGFVSDRDAAWRAYQASVGARALRRLTWDLASASEQKHAQATLEWLAEFARAPSLREWCLEVLDAWRRKRGLSSITSDELLMKEHRRQRISKSMAYHLRHGTVVTLDNDGWASVEELVAAIGKGVSGREVSVVASTLSDPRFEYRDGMVRARYGHSRLVEGAGEGEGSLADATRGYHATTVDAIQSIIERRQGLIPMSRLFVHLSRSIPESLRSGLRQGYPVLLSTDSNATRTLTSRGGNTLIANAVPLSALRVESVVTHWAELPPVAGALQVSMA